MLTGQKSSQIQTVVKVFRLAPIKGGGFTRAPEAFDDGRNNQFNFEVSERSLSMRVATAIVDSEER